MENKKSLYLALSLGVLALGIFIFDQVKESRSKVKLPDLVIEEGKISEINKMVISNNGNTIELHRKENGFWTVSHQQNEFPGDGQKIGKFLDSLSKIKPESLVASNPSDLGIYGLSDKEKKIDLLVNEKNIVTLKIGDQRKGGGIFFKFNNNNEVYLTKESFSVETDSDSWDLKTLANIKKENIKEVSFYRYKSSKPEVVLKREKAEDKLKLVGVDETKESIKESSITESETLLENLSYNKKFDLSNVELQTAMGKPDRVEMVLFDGRIFNLEVGKMGEKDKEKYFLKLNVAGDLSKLDPLLKESSEILNSMMQKNGFEVSSWVGKKFIKSKDAFKEKKKS